MIIYSTGYRHAHEPSNGQLQADDSNQYAIAVIELVIFKNFF